MSGKSFDKEYTDLMVGGIVGGKKVPGYRQEPNVDPNSTVETYAPIKLRIDNWRWAGVPFYLRSGKRMPRRTITIVVRFKTPPLSLFASHEADPISPNYLIFKIQPEERNCASGSRENSGTNNYYEVCEAGFWLQTNSGTDNRQQGTKNYSMTAWLGMGVCFIDLTWSKRTGRWLLRFSRLEVTHPPTDFPNYAAGIWGPEAALRLIQRDQHQWFSLDKAAVEYEGVHSKGVKFQQMYEKRMEITRR